MANKKSRTRRSTSMATIQMPALSWFGAFVGLLLIMVVSGLSVVRHADEMRRLYQAAGDVQREQDNLLSEHSRLLLERSAMTSMQNVEQIAESELDMLFPTQMGEVLR